MVDSLPVCGSALDQAILNTAANLAAPAAPIVVGSVASFDIAVSSPSKKIVQLGIREAWVSSTKYAADPLWANRTLVENYAWTALGTALSAAAANGLIYSIADSGSNSAQNGISFSAIAGTDPAAALLKTSDLGTANNAFGLHISLGIFYDVQSSLPQRRRRRLEMVELDNEPSVGPGLTQHSGSADVEVVHVHAGGEAYLAKRAVQISATAEQGQISSVESQFVVVGARAPAQTVPVGAIAGLVLGLAALSAGIVTIVVLGRQRRKLLQEEAAQPADKVDEVASISKEQLDCAVGDEPSAHAIGEDSPAKPVRRRSGPDAFEATLRKPCTVVEGPPSYAPGSAPKEADASDGVSTLDDSESSIVDMYS
ncbi:hypothetical protein DFJ74DRAFT_516404 [Hyaloraphidium curvatum]|nr:hypothetical protein DFJ74DRAFT_516404 [Hyaloraphidium curvatum]